MARLPVWLTLLLICFSPVAALAQDPLVAGANINMVSGTEFPGGDPFLQRQNEPSLAVSTRNTLHLLGGANDYRTVDIPGLPDGKAVGDSWPGVFSSTNGGGSWVSTLLPGFPQDNTAKGLASPLKGYEAGADPVIRAGTNGLFYYSGIVFDRGDESPSAAFVARFMDLNNDPRIPSAFEDGPIRYIDTQLIDTDPGGPGSEFIDKPWMAVDIPRPGSQRVLLQVPQGNGTVDQWVDCGNVYVAYAKISGEHTADIDSHIMFSRSTDCGGSFSNPVELDGPDVTINQGTSVAINPLNGDIYVTWRQFRNATLSCTRGSVYWAENPDEWPVERFMVGGVLYNKQQALAIMAGHQNGNPWLLARELIVAKLNVLAGAADGDVVAAIAAADASLIESGWVYEGDGTIKEKDKKNNNNGKGNTKEKTNSSPAFALSVMLAEYNTGLTGPGNCDSFDASGGDQAGGQNPDAIMFVKSVDGGITFSEPVLISELIPFDQNTTQFTFRANSYPTMTVDDIGRIYVAWSTRGRPGEPEYVDSRIVVSTSLDGTSWTLDPDPVDQDPSKPRGHQIQPTLTFSNGKLILVYLDFRQDRSEIFERFIADVPTDPPTYRHTVDVRAAQADPDTNPEFANYSILNAGSTQLSRYFNLMLQWETNAQPTREQLQYNPLNQPLFKGGTVPFIGDYIDVAPSPAFVPDTTEPMGWRYNTRNDNSPVFHAAWSDNRDVRGPPDGDWTKYVPPTNPYSGGVSLFDGTTPVQACVPGVNEEFTGMRNQNIYTARISHGLTVAVPANSKPLNPNQPRSFVVFVKYATNNFSLNGPAGKTFTFRIAEQPVGGTASFDQFSQVDELTVTIGNNSSTARTVFVTSSDPFAPVDIIVEEANGNLRGTARINPDPTNPLPIAQDERFTSGILDSKEFFRSNIFDDNSVFDSTADGTLFLKHDPDNPFLFEEGKIDPTLNTTQLEFLSQALVQLSLSNPDVFNPGIYNPGIYNPGIYNPGIYNPGIYNPGIYNPGIYNPGIYNPGIYNPGIYNPGIYNPGIYNGTITDANYTITNNGDSTTAYDVNLRLDNPSTEYSYQLIVSRIYKTPVADGCQVIAAPVQEVLLNNINPNLSGDLFNSNSLDSFYLEPGDTAIVTLRIIPKVPAPTAPPAVETISVSVVPDGVDEDKVTQGETKPTANVVLSETQKANPLVITTTTLAAARGGYDYNVQLAATGGDGPRSWSLVPGSALPAGMTLSSAGVLSGIPVVAGNYNFTVRVQDLAQTNQLALNLEVSEPPDLVVSSLTHSPVNPDASDLITFTAVVTNQGGESAAASTLEFRIGGESPSAANAFAVPTLAAGASFTVVRQAQLTAQNYRNTAIADRNNVVVESNEANNTTTDDYTVEAPVVSIPPWTISGLGQTQATQAAPNEWNLSYSVNPAGLSTSRTWTVESSPMVTAGDYTFNWTYTGHHAYFQVRAFLNADDGGPVSLVNAGPQNCCVEPSGGFSYSGSYTFTNVQIGDTLRFTMGGQNFDSNNFLSGNLNLELTAGPQILTLPPAAKYETTLNLQEPVTGDDIDKVVYWWSTDKAAGHVSSADMSEFSMALYSGNALVYFDHIIGSNSLLPIQGNPGASTPRPAADELWDFSLDIPALSQFRNFLWNTVETTNGEQFLVGDNVALSVDGEVWFYKYVDGQQVDFAVGHLSTQSTTVLGP